MNDFLYRLRSFDFQKFIASNKLVPAMEAFVIANTTLFVGMFIYQIINPVLLIEISNLGLDLSLIAIGIIWALVISDPTGVAILVFGWILAGTYTKKRYGDDTASIIIRAAAIPVVFILLTLGVVVLALSLVPGVGFFLIFTILFYSLILFVFSVILALGGIIVSQFFTFNDRYDPIFSIEEDYLVLPVVPEGEKVKHCPFRSKEPGCSYLGYDAPDTALICDYRSSYLRCRVYAHIYDQLEDDLK